MAGQFATIGSTICAPPPLLAALPSNGRFFPRPRLFGGRLLVQRAPAPLGRVQPRPHVPPALPHAAPHLPEGRRPPPPLPRLPVPYALPRPSAGRPRARLCARLLAKEAVHHRK